MLVDFHDERTIYYGLCILSRIARIKLKRLDEDTFIYYCDVFLSCLDSHSDGTHSLLPLVHWWASDVMLHSSKPVVMKKQTSLPLENPEDEVGELFI